MIYGREFWKKLGNVGHEIPDAADFVDELSSELGGLKWMALGNS